MDENLRKKLDELYKIIDSLDYVKKLSNIKNKISPELVELINVYRINPTVSNKKKLYENDIFLEYIENEIKLNYLIMEINNKFKRKRGQCESN